MPQISLCSFALDRMDNIPFSFTCRWLIPSTATMISAMLTFPSRSCRPSSRHDCRPAGAIHVSFTSIVFVYRYLLVKPLLRYPRRPASGVLATFPDEGVFAPDSSDNDGAGSSASCHPQGPP